MFEMKKIASGIIVVSLVLGMMLSGCSNIKNFGGSPNGIYLFDDLVVRDVAIEEFGDNYDYDEFLKAVQDDLDAFNKEQDFKLPEDSLDRDGNLKEDARIKAPISIASSEDGKKVNLQLLYANPKFYADYNQSDMELRGGKEFLAGTFKNPDSRIATGSFVTPKGEAFDISECQGEKYRYVLCDFDALIYGDGSIIAFSKGLSYDKSSESVEVKSGNVGIVIFK